ncbi:dolichyl-phosphate-mannose--protein mannosyltransferase [Microbacterium sp. CFBP9034]|uniref:dolichyl-phosphate-mannose--protein mannosyltransferase n=1 Tax=Microbacterium sp. CFBP9034 TaxID=3096540 RepID=UPI002A6ACE19|nr:phospholipid carrier-dependent glycosyltransferase [Microbacterium sp. CFBP9034]MDY0911006.1 phospholipid carrier-dependent glycosyltransferase [Microbacterium sp. CFBP9034]
MTHAPRLDADPPAESLLPPVRPSLYDRFVLHLSLDPRAARLYGWIGPAIVVVLAGVLRLWNLGAAHDLMNQFDETYYVKDAWTLSQLGYEAAWPAEANDRFLAGATDIFTTDPAFVIHPPLGKWIIALGMMIVGPENGWGWRLTTALLGTAAVLVLMLIAKRLTRSTTFAVIAGLLMAVDGLAISMSRVALLDTPLMFFVLLAFLFVLLDRERTMTRIAQTVAARFDEHDEPPSWGPILWNRPWIVAAGTALGAATAVKWSGAWVLAGLGVYLVVTDALARRRAGVLFWPTDAIRQGAATFLLLVPVAVVVYLASWTGWLVSDGGYSRHAADANPATGPWSWVPLSLQSLWLDHVTMFNAASQITSGHTYASPAWQWPLLLRPTGMYYHHDVLGTDGCTAVNGCSSVIASIPNPLIWYAAVAAVLYLAYRFVVARDWRHALVLTGIAVTYVPWLFYPERTIFQFYTVLMLPFMLLALVFALRDIAGPAHADAYRRHTGQRLVLVFLVVALALSAFWYPVISAMTVPYDFWRLHNWMPTWV